MKSKNCSKHLTLVDAIEIWKRRAAGEAQHKLADDFSVKILRGSVKSCTGPNSRKPSAFPA